MVVPYRPVKFCVSTGIQTISCVVGCKAKNVKILNLHVKALFIKFYPQNVAIVKCLPIFCSSGQDRRTVSYGTTAWHNIFKL